MNDGDTRWGPPIDVRALFRREQGELIALLEALSPEQWAAPTACTDWNVHDVAAHILGDHLGRLSRGRDGYASHRAPGAGEPFPAFIDRINAEWVTAAARLSPKVLIALLAGAGSQIAGYWESIDANAIDGSVYWAGPEPAPTWLDMARDYTEYWVHQQQIREAVGAPRLDQAHFRSPVVDTFARALPHTLRDVRAPAGAQLQVTVTGDSGGTWTATSQEPGWLLRRGGADLPTAALETDPDTFWRLCTRNITPEEARPLIDARGDSELALAALQIVSIIVSEPPPGSGRPPAATR